jgi:cell division protein FtsQ
MPVTAPADRRFKRAHVKPARKRGAFSMRRLHTAVTGIIIALTVYAGYRAVAVVSGLDIFRIDRINVRGNHRLSSGEVLAMLENLRGRSVLAVDLAEWRRALLSSPWVADASLRRTLPSTVEVVILERAPLGIGRINGALFLVDDRGAVIDEYGPNYADLDLPIIDGLSSTGEAQADVYRALLARRLLDALRVRNMASQISQIDVSDARNAVVLLEGDPTLIRLGNERFVERLQSYRELAPALREQVPAIDYVDLRFDERVYVRPARERKTPAAGAKTAPVKSARPTQTG